MQRIAVIAILAVAAAARLWFLHAGVPHAVGIDEPQVIGRALAIVRTGDWNPHVFDYPTLVIYLHTAVAIVRFLLGAVRGEWSSLDGFSIDAVYGSGRFVAALIGILTVYFAYRLARELSGRPAATLAAALLAVHPLHIRESHFILTDVPMTALTTLGVWLAVRASRRHDAGAYAWAGAVCGLAAAAKYTGGIALAAPVAAWAYSEWRRPRRWLTLAAILGSAAIAFIAAAPFTVLDLPAFLDGFAAQFARFATPSAGDPAWIVYVKHLSPASARAAVPLALAGIAILLRQRETRRAVVPVAAFAFVYFYVISSHSHVFGRYALPLVPIVCVLSSVAAIALVRYAQARGPFRTRPAVAAALMVAAVVFLLWPPASQAVQWLEQYKRSDTRTIAAQWLKANAPKGARMAVENNGPTYLDAAGFRIAPTELLVDHPIDWFRARADYLVISATDLSRYGEYLAAGPTVFQVSPTAQRWGPPIVVVSLQPAVAP